MLQSPVDIALIAGVVLLIFGPKKVPEMGKALGLGIGNFKKALFEAQEEVKSAIKDDPAHPTVTSTTATSSATPALAAPVASSSEGKTEAVAEKPVVVDETSRPIV
ncbi:MAG: twin-arginine translocase TatA/TatE family subunit [Candidatus Obscuribacterales bacterium]|nr:twin-arginine translocase TatA/TatE family subunit [Candidatus Obscuribacterales bacterium]